MSFDYSCMTRYSDLRSRYDTEGEPYFLHRFFGRVSSLEKEINNLAHQCRQLGIDVDVRVIMQLRRGVTC